jgi:hypothetical protein
MAEITRTTSNMLQMLPAWMRARVDSDNSNTAQFINILGQQIQNIDNLVVDIKNNIYLNRTPESFFSLSTIPQWYDDDYTGIALGTIDLLYKIYIRDNHFVDTVVEFNNESDPNTVYGDGVQLTRAYTIFEFYQIGLDKYYYSDDTVYFKRNFSQITINNQPYTSLTEHMVWGPYDEIGLLLGCARLKNERNPEYKARLLDVCKNKGNASKDGLKNYISRSLGISIGDITIQELDEEYVESLLSENGTPSDQLKSYIEISNTLNTNKSNAYWEVLEDNKLGLQYLPIVWDILLDDFKPSQIQSGIGDDDDLLVRPPQDEEEIQTFSYGVSAEGLAVQQKTTYPQHNFMYKLVARGQSIENAITPEQYQYTVNAAERIAPVFTVKAFDDYETFSTQDFGGTIVDISTVTSGDLKPSSYITNNVTARVGNLSYTADARYLEIFAKLNSRVGRTEQSKISSIVITYLDSGSNIKTITFDGEASQSDDGLGNRRSNFFLDTWTDVTPTIKVKSDTNDRYNVEIDSISKDLQLVQGDYVDKYDTYGTWTDGSMYNVRQTSGGTLRLAL